MAMNPKTDEEKLTADLAALGAVAQGTPKQTAQTPVSDPEREAKIAELKAKYQSGELTTDADALAAKLVDAHLKTDMLG